MEFKVVWFFSAVALLSCLPVHCFDPRGSEGSKPIPEWLLEAQLANSVPRIGRRSLSPFSKTRGEGFRFFSGDSPRGFGSSKNLKGYLSRIFGSSGAGFSQDSDTDEIESTLKDKRTEEVPLKRRGLPPHILGDDEYWNEFLKGARKSVMDKLAQLSLMTDLEEETEDKVDQELDSVSPSSPLTKYFSRYPVESKLLTPPAKATRADILNSMNGFRGFVRNNI